MDLEGKRDFEKKHNGMLLITKTDLDKPQVPYLCWHPSLVECPNCAALILNQTRKCKYCGQTMIYPGEEGYDEIFKQQGEIDEKYGFDGYQNFGKS